MRLAMHYGNLIHMKRVLALTLVSFLSASCLAEYRLTSDSDNAGTEKPAAVAARRVIKKNFGFRCIFFQG